ncbi:hypothetical protein STANM309S_00032 [Streptomyces tanashiensis]
MRQKKPWPRSSQIHAAKEAIESQARVLIRGSLPQIAGDERLIG